MTNENPIIVTMIDTYKSYSHCSMINNWDYKELFRQLIQFSAYHSALFFDAYTREQTTDESTSVKEALTNIFTTALAGNHTSAEISYGNNVISKDGILIESYFYKPSPHQSHIKRESPRATNTLYFELTVSKNNTNKRTYILTATQMSDIKNEFPTYGTSYM